MNEQERQQGPVVAEQIVPPSPQNTIWKSSALILGIILIVVVAGGLYFYFHKTSSLVSVKDSTSPVTFNDADLKISYTSSPSISDNSAPAFNAISGNSVAPADTTILTQYIASSTPTNLPPVTQANKIISKYQPLLKIFDENATKPYQCNLGKGESCYLNSVRGMTYLAGVRALISFEQNKISDAQTTAKNLVSLGKNITAQADAEITLLVGWVAQKTGYTVLSIVNSKNKAPTYTETEKDTLIAQLRSEHKKVLQYSYTRMAEGIDFITSPDKRPVNQATSAEDEEHVNKYRKAIAENPAAWNPIETKKYFYDSYKIMISNVDLPCGANLPESKIETGFNPDDQKAENYIGKTLYSTAYSGLNTMNAKRCEVESAIQNL
jgi:hypothetical protein